MDSLDRTGRLLEPPEDLCIMASLIISMEIVTAVSYCCRECRILLPITTCGYHQLWGIEKQGILIRIDTTAVESLLIRVIAQAVERRIRCHIA